jgi:hypothetical protein
MPLYPLVQHESGVGGIEVLIELVGRLALEREPVERWLARVKAV